MRVGGRRRRRHCRRPGIASDREVLAVPYPGFGWPDDSCCLRAAAEGLQPGHPGEQRIEAGSHEIGQPPIKRAAGTGVAREKVLIDPAHDFGKNTFHGLLLLRHVADLVMTGWPVLMALSNKDVVGETLGVDLTERLEGTLAATALAAAAGARMFRVHEVAATRRVLEMVASIQGVRPPTRTVRGLA